MEEWRSVVQDAVCPLRNGATTVGFISEPTLLYRSLMEQHRTKEEGNAAVDRCATAIWLSHTCSVELTVGKVASGDVRRVVIRGGVREKLGPLGGHW